VLLALYGSYAHELVIHARLGFLSSEFFRFLIALVLFVMTDVEDDVLVSVALQLRFLNSSELLFYYCSSPFLPLIIMSTIPSG